MKPALNDKRKTPSQAEVGPSTEYGLMGFGHAGEWEASLDANVAGTSFRLQLEGAAIYLTLSITNPEVVGQCADYLAKRSDSFFTIGSLGKLPVNLSWDDEAHRCFLIIGPQERDCIRFTLSQKDIADLQAAFGQLLDDLA